MAAKKIRPEHAGRTFIEQTTYKYAVPSDQRKGMPQPPLQVPFAGIPIALPAPDEIEVPPTDLRSAIDARQSVRRYAETPLSLEELSYLLWCTQGVKGVQDSYATFRTVPSAGARHAFETYLLVNRVEDLEPGLYRFLPLEHQLLQVDLGPEIAVGITRACHNQRFVLASAVTFLWVAIPYRMTWRYGERGYRYLHLDAGHVCQNLYLAAEALKCGVCAIAAFSDEDLGRLLGLNDADSQSPASGETEQGDAFVIYIAALGRKPAE